MFKRLVTDIGISALILVMIGSAYFMTAQKILLQRADGMELCGQVDMLQESLDKLTLRKGLVAHKALSDDTKRNLVIGYNEQIAIFEEKIRDCDTIN